MSDEILDWSVIDYKSTVELLLQQKGSRFRGMVMEDSYHGKSGAAVNQIGAVTAQKRTTRHADTHSLTLLMIAGGFSRPIMNGPL